MKRRFFTTLVALACALCLLLSALPAAAEAPGAYAYAFVSGTGSLNLRCGPGTDYSALGTLTPGVYVGILGEENGWARVYVPSTGQTGYVSKNFLAMAGSTAPTAAPTAAPVSGIGTGVVSNPKASSFLNLRQYPSLDAPVLGIYYNGAAFTLLGDAGGGWYQVQINGQVGYFRREFVTLNGSSGGGTVSGLTAFVSTPNGGKVNLRNLPSYAGSSVLAQFLNGTPLTVLNQAGSFWTVNIQGMTGYMDSAFISFGGVSPSTPTSKPATHGTAVVRNPKATQVLNLRAKPSTNAKVIAQYKNGTKFEVIAPGETWTKVYGAATGNIGYFMTRYLKLSGVSSSPTRVVQNSGSYVNLRSTPRKVSGNIILQAPSGAVVTVLTPGDEWTQVRYNGKTGYIMTGFLK